MQIKNIIFDLGGVLLNIDYQRTRQAFIDMGVTDFDHYYQQSHSNVLFSKLETGEIEPTEFYEQLRQTTGLPLTDQMIQDAWNAMLLDFRSESIKWLAGLKSQYRLFLFSNTNAIHLAAFRNIHFRQFGHHGFDDHFEKAWYSHEFGLRKPHVASYQALLQKHALAANETLFVDDTLSNIEGAAKAGMQTFWLQPGMQVENAGIA